MSSVTTRSTRRRTMKPQRLTRGSAIKTMLSRTDIVGMMPSALRSSGSSAVPAASDERGEPVRTRRSPTRTVPRSSRCVPKIAFTVSERPEPNSPAKPSTSPAADRQRHVNQLVPAGESFGVEQHVIEHSLVACERGEALGADVGDVPTEHRGDHLELGRVADQAGPGAPAVAQDRDAVGDLEHLLEVVADEEQRDSGAAQASDHSEHLGHLTRLERGRRLVEDHDARVGRHRAHDGDHLLDPRAERVHRAPDVDVDAVAAQQRRGPAVHLADIEEPPSGTAARCPGTGCGRPTSSAPA